MLYSKLCELINDFPKLNDVYKEKVDEGFSITTIRASSIPPDQLIVDYRNIEIQMEDKSGKRIVLSYSESSQKSNVLTINEIPLKAEKIHENIMLNPLTIHNKEFKKKLFGGYDEDEVNSFLDIIIRDYKMMEDVIREMKILKEDLNKLRR
jgi:DivIVA domain-containing protein